MNPDAFKTALQRGLGRALLHLKHDPSPGARPLVLEALLNSTRTDPQVEGVGSPYLLEATRLAGLQDHLTGTLTAALQQLLQTEDPPGATLEQLLDLLGELGAQGDREASAALLDFIPVVVENHWEHLRDLTAALCTGLGRPGLRVLLQNVGATLLQEPDPPEDDRLLWVATETLGEETETEVERWATQDPGIQLYLQQARESRKQRESRQVPELDTSYAALRKRVEGGGTHCSGLPLRGKKASPDTLARLTRDVLQEEDPARLALLLCVFQLRAFPAGPEPLLKLLEHPTLRVKKGALAALAQFEGDSIHALALQCLADQEHRLEGMALLQKAFQRGDETAVATALRQVVADESEAALHDFVRALDRLAAAHPTPELLDLLVDAFPHQPCSFCREVLFGVLEKHHHLPRPLLEEAALDRNLDLRERAVQHLH